MFLSLLDLLQIFNKQITKNNYFVEKNSSFTICKTVI